ncbi:MAG: fused MFS/spermidine synthase [Caldilineaceae bacterium]|nr:fused MFS/spermidine synthase [Caldilineaceae bacterium]
MKFISLLVFAAGAVTLGVELSAARLLDPWFGNSQIVWAGLIGLILLYLAVGAWLGGRLADRHPHLDGLLAVTSLAGVGVALIPAISLPILRLAAQGLAGYAIGLLAGTLLAVLLLFSLPIILLGAVAPWAVRLAVARVEQSGQVAGRLYAISTLGSIVGTFLPVLWLIPTFGTRWSFSLLALGLLVICAMGGLFFVAGGRWRWLPLACLLFTAVLFALDNPGSLRGGAADSAEGVLLYEDESLYNYIAVRAWGNERHLKLNEGVGIHSVYHPETLLSQGIWDYFLLAPLFQPDGLVNRPRAEQSELPELSELSEQKVLVIGLAAGTVPGLFAAVYEASDGNSSNGGYGSWAVTGVELDPEILEVGRRFFGMEQPNLTAIAADGRRWLRQQPDETKFDLILVDAYRPPYIPFHLATVEFFGLVRSHLSERGVVAINVGRTSRNFSLVDALAETLGTVFPAVFVIDEPGPADDLGNSLVVATARPLSLAEFRAHAAALSAPLPAEFRAFVAQAAPRVRAATPPADTPIFTDDHAPIEAMVHSIIWDFLQGDK